MNAIEYSEIKKVDLSWMLEIYNHYVLHSTATFHTRPISIAELEEMIPIEHPVYTSYIVRSEGRMLGYCYTSRYKPREAYDRTAEVTVYLHPEETLKGIGIQCLQKIEQAACEAGIKVLIGTISGDNVGSIRLFEKAGYNKCSHMKRVGKKFGQILDVVAYQKIISES